MLRIKYFLAKSADYSGDYASKTETCTYSLHLFLAQTNFSVVAGYRDSLILLSDDKLVKNNNISLVPA